MTLTRVDYVDRHGKPLAWLNVPVPDEYRTEAEYQAAARAATEARRRAMPTNAPAPRRGGGRGEA